MLYTFFAGISIILFSCTGKEIDSTLINLRNDNQLKTNIKNTYKNTAGVETDIQIEKAFYRKNPNFGGFDHNQIYIKVTTLAEPKITLPNIIISTNSYKSGKKNSFLIWQSNFEERDLRSYIVKEVMKKVVIQRYEEKIEKVLNVNDMFSIRGTTYLTFQIFDEELKKNFIQGYQIGGNVFEKYNNRIIDTFNIFASGNKNYEDLNMDQVLSSLRHFLPKGDFYRFHYTLYPLNSGETHIFCFETRSGIYDLELHK